MEIEESKEYEQKGMIPVVDLNNIPEKVAHVASPAYKKVRGALSNKQCCQPRT